jgi:hypothetical protein
MTVASKMIPLRGRSRIARAGQRVSHPTVKKRSGDARTGAPRFRLVGYTPGIRISDSWPPSRLYVKSG